MTFLAPGFLIAAGLVSLGVVVLHLLVTQQPRSEQLPTVRFVPDVPARSTSVTIRPSDLFLLLLRVLVIMLIGAAFAQPQLKPKHQTIARIVAIDVSRAAANPAEVADSARKFTQGAAAVVLFDSTAREVPVASAMDSVTAQGRQPRAPQRNALSAAMITSLRAASRVRGAADSIDMVVVSPFLANERDAATMSVRSLWPGHVHSVRVSPVTDSSATRANTAQKVRVEWADSGAATMWSKREHVDTIGAVRVGDNVLVSQFPRRWQPNVKLDSVTRVYARWMDGEPAGFERVTADGCVRSMGVAMPSAGDVALRPDFIRFTQALTAPCGTAHDMTPLPADFMTAFDGPEKLAATNTVKPQVAHMTPLVPWLLLAALIISFLEFFIRRRGSEAESEEAALNSLDNRKVSGRAA